MKKFLLLMIMGTLTLAISCSSVRSRNQMETKKLQRDLKKAEKTTHIVFASIKKNSIQKSFRYYSRKFRAAMTRKKEAVYQAALLDPHTAAELPIDDIIAMCDELIEAHGDYLPDFI